MSTYRHIRFQLIEECDQLDFIESKHHAYAQSMLNLMRRNFKSALHSNPRWKSEILDLICLLEQLNEQINALVELEEKSLFPFIRKLVEVEQHHEPLRFLSVNLVESSIKSIKNCHNHIVALLHSLRTVSNDFKAPVSASELLKLCYAELEEFEKEYLGNLSRKENGLFPRIVQLEQKVRSKSVLAPFGMSLQGRDD